jgi:hypothetical protein
MRAAASCYLKPSPATAEVARVSGEPAGDVDVVLAASLATS